MPGAKEVERLGPLARQEARETLHDLETYLAKEIFKHNGQPLPLTLHFPAW